MSYLEKRRVGWSTCFRIPSSRRHFFSEVADLVEVLVDTGMKLSETLDLVHDDINFGTNLISI